MSQEIFEALKRKDLKTLGEILDRDPSLLDSRSEKGETLALLAAYTGQPEVADMLIARGARLSLFEAAALGRSEDVKAWTTRDPGLVHGLSADGFTPLALASYFGHVRIVEHLLGMGASLEAAAQNALKIRPLHAALAGGHMGIARRLIAAGADVNAPQQAGFTPLHQAVMRNDIEMVRLLIEKGARTNTKGDDGQTPLALAIECGHADVADLLRAHDA